MKIKTNLSRFCGQLKFKPTLSPSELLYMIKYVYKEDKSVRNLCQILSVCDSFVSYSLLRTMVTNLYP